MILNEFDPLGCPQFKQSFPFGRKRPDRGHRPGACCTDQFIAVTIDITTIRG